MLGNILLGVVALCTMIAYLPQTIKLIKTKKADDISLLSWIIWVISSCCYTLYAVLVSKDFMLIFETSLELLFCIIILVLSYIYQGSNK